MVKSPTCLPSCEISYCYDPFVQTISTSILSPWDLVQSKNLLQLSLIVHLWHLMLIQRGRIVGFWSNFIILLRTKNFWFSNCPKEVMFHSLSLTFNNLSFFAKDEIWPANSVERIPPFFGQISKSNMSEQHVSNLKSRCISHVFLWHFLEHLSSLILRRFV